MSTIGVNGAFVAATHSTETGSPGTIGAAATPVVNITATDASATEIGNDTGTFRISRTGSTVGPLTVSYTIATGAGQATSADYTPTLTGAATIPSGQSFVDITITPVNDNLLEGIEFVTLTLGDSGSYDVGANKTAIVTIATRSSESQQAMPIRVARCCGRGSMASAKCGSDGASFDGCELWWIAANIPSYE